MYEAASLNTIRNRIKGQLPREIVVFRKEPVNEISFMTPQQMNKPVRYQTVRSTEERGSKLVGILLCHPGSPVAKSEILEHLPFFHVRSGEAIDFFCAGYGAYWPPNHHIDSKEVTEIDGEKWLFSNEAFHQVIEEIEDESKWRYGGETELLLIPVTKSNNGEVTFQYDYSIVCNLEAMAKDGAFSSVRAFFDRIFRFAKSKSASDSTWEFSDKLGVEVAGGVLKDFIISLLPKQLKSGYKKASHYAVKNLANDF